ncbi:hypothetical protein CP985_04720 [Malaciobacter mytili LMG 24559]|uniref:Transmembrane protein n=1 Tax=Malaciobacter mytili LMG 24559 TaxID=1032238 RepID=A0AAX2AJF1_9BACT|nr:hypothetical protein [Malaciobacter mytili]AXH15656.1 hypothetical protein AMYT_2107 [Malaciobacter mytili LMG 24559]RXK16158.1 hypothetical protein CP985_04720 [Malaciobacter mytili LMG 24559]
MEKFIDFKTVLISVDEEILQKNLDKFIDTSLKLKGIKVKINENIFYTFIKELNSYQITIFKTNKFYFSNLEKYIKNESIYTLFVYENYLILYKNKKLYYYQYLKYKLTKEQIKEYFFKRFNFSSVEPIYLNSLSFQKDINSSSNIKFKYLFLFLATLLFSFALFSLFKNKNLKKQEVSLYQEKKLLSTQLIKLFKEINNSNIYIKNLNFTKGEFKVVFYSKEQVSLYKFINNNKKYLDTKEVSFNEESKYYELFGSIYTTRK